MITDLIERTIVNDINIHTTLLYGKAVTAETLFDTGSVKVLNWIIATYSLDLTKKEDLDKLFINFFFIKGVFKDGYFYASVISFKELITAKKFFNKFNYDFNFKMKSLLNLDILKLLYENTTIQGREINILSELKSIFDTKKLNYIHSSFLSYIDNKISLENFYLSFTEKECGEKEIIPTNIISNSLNKDSRCFLVNYLKYNDYDKEVIFSKLKTALDHVDIITDLKEKYTVGLAVINLKEYIEGNL